MNHGSSDSFLCIGSTCDISHWCKKEKREVNCEGSVESETKTIHSPSLMNIVYLSVDEDVRRWGRRWRWISLVSYQLKANGLAQLVWKWWRWHSIGWMNAINRRAKALGIFSLVQLKLAGLFWPVVEPWLLFQLLRRPKELPCRPKRSSVGVAQCDRKLLNATLSNLAGTVNQLLSRQTVFCCYF